jgi:hypothetical protein
MLVRDTVHLCKERQPPGVVRVWAYEFGDRPDSLVAGWEPEFQDLRASQEFPGSALAHAQLLPINIRRGDLWRLIDPAASDGAMVVWPISPARDFGPGTAHRTSIENIATRVISLVRVTCPNVRSARARAALNVRSLAVAEEAWRMHADVLLSRAEHLLRHEFETVIGSQIPFDLQLAAGRATPLDNSDPCSNMLQAMASRTALRLGPATFETGRGFWESAGRALGHFPVEMREQVSLACGFAAPFVPAAICYSPTHQTGSTTDVDCIIDRTPRAAGAESRPAGQLIELQARRRGRTDQPALLPTTGGRTSTATDATDDTGDRHEFLDRLEERTAVALRFPPGHGTPACRARALLNCEADFLEHLDVNGFFLPCELDRIQRSPTLSALVRHIIESKPHAIVSRLQASLTILAAFGPATAVSIDECLRKFLPPAWPATQLLKAIEERWALRQALGIVQRAGRVPADEAAELRNALLARLSCDSFVIPRPAIRAVHKASARSRPV